jgi:hypothetical protein
MRYLLAFLCFIAPVGAALAADACVPVRAMTFDAFFGDSLSVDVPLQLLVPEGYEHVEFEAAPMYHYWMRPEAMDAARASGDLPFATGYLYGKISMDVAYDPATQRFSDEDNLVAVLEEQGLEVVGHEAVVRNGHRLLFIESVMGGKPVYSLYVGLNVATNAAYLSFMPAGRDRKAGDCFWAAFKQALLASPEVATRPAPKSDDQFHGEALAAEGSDEALMQSFLLSARAGDVDALLSMFSPMPMEATGEAAVRDYLRTEILPFFAGAARLDTYTRTTGASFEDGTTGRLHYGYIVDAAGKSKPWHIALRDEGGATKVMNVFVGVCVPKRHPVTEGRCER